MSTASPAFKTMNTLLHSSHDGQQPVVVEEEDGIRTLHFGNDARQSCFAVQEPARLVLAYTRWMMTALLVPPRLRSVLLLGLGGGAMVRFLLHHHPGCTIDAVEISGTVITQARELFNLPSTESLRIHRDDAARFVENQPYSSYELVLVDLFEAEAMAPPLFSPAFYHNIRNLLTPDGVMAANLWSGDRQAYRLARQSAIGAFDHQLLEMSVKKRSNTIMLAFPGPLPKQRLRTVRKQATSSVQYYGLNFPRYLKKLRRTNRLPLFSPSVFLKHPNHDELAKSRKRHLHCT